MNKLATSILILVFFTSEATPQELSLSTQENDSSTEISLLFAGDIMQHGQQLQAAKQKDGYDYWPNYKYISPIIKSVDIAFANLELTLAGEPYSGYPTFSAPDELAVAVKKAGFDFLVTANNHSLDRRKKGLERTIKVLDSLQIPHTGTFASSEEKKNSYPAFIEKNGFKIAVLNYTYGTNGIPVTEPNIVNALELKSILKDLETAEAENPDIRIVFLHWGYEYQPMPSVEQRVIAEKLLKAGVDLVIGSHPHVIQPIHKTEDNGKSQLVCYSLGNFISNQRTSPRDGGMMLEVKYKKEGSKVTMTDAGYHLQWVHRTASPNMQFHLIPEGIPSSLNRARLQKEDINKMETFLMDSRKLMSKQNKGVKEIRRWPVLEKVSPRDWNGQAYKPAADSYHEPKSSEENQSQKVESSTEKEQLIKKQTRPRKNPKKEINTNSFSIQIFAGKGEPDLSSIGPWLKQLTKIKQGEITKYQIGAWGTREEAEEILKKIKVQTDFDDAFIVKRTKIVR